MDNEAKFTLSLAFDSVAQASEDYKNPLLTWVTLVFSDDKPNVNKQGVSQTEFPNLIRSMAHMPIKASFNGEDLAGHFGSDIIGTIKEGKQDGDKLVAMGALFNDEFPEVVDFFKKEVAEGRGVNFSWEIRYKDASVDDTGVEWLSGTTTKAVTAVKNPAYKGRTPLMSISEDFLTQVKEEIKKRETIGVVS
jgi:hypothetical protein